MLKNQHVQFEVDFIHYLIDKIRLLLSMGAVFSMLGGLYFWFEKITGVCYAEILGKIHF
jgi:cytochrome c oxidase subunit I